MKKILTLLAFVVSLGLSAQTYVSGSFSYYNGAGSFGVQSMGTVEAGRYLANNFTAGVAVGVTAFSGGKLYTEFRPTYYLTNGGKFSQGFTIGVGAVYDTPTPFMVEWATNTSYQFHKNWGTSLGIGGYNFNGKVFAAEYTYVGVGITYTFDKKK